MHTPTDNPGTHVELKETPYKGWYLSQSHISVNSYIRQWQK